MDNSNNKPRQLTTVLAVILFLCITSLNTAFSQGLVDYTGVWWPVDKEAIVPELVVKQASAEDLMVFFFKTCTTEASGKCFWGEAKGIPQSINNPSADPVQNTDEVTGAFAEFPDKVRFTLSMIDKNLLRLDLSFNTKTGIVRKVYNFNPKPSKPNPVVETEVITDVKLRDDVILKPEYKPNTEIKKVPDVRLSENMTTGTISGRAKGLTQHCTKYAVIVLKEGDRHSKFLDPDPSDCSFSLSGLAPGKYLVSVLINYPHKDDYNISPGQIDNVVYVKAGRTSQFDFTISHRESANNNQISGTLSNTRSCGFYQVSFYNAATGESKSGRFDSSTCRYLVEDLNPGTWQVRLGFAGKADGIVNAEAYPKTITIGKGDRKVIHFRLK